MVFGTWLGSNHQLSVRKKEPTLPWTPQRPQELHITTYTPIPFFVYVDKCYFVRKLRGLIAANGNVWVCIAPKKHCSAGPSLFRLKAGSVSFIKSPATAYPCRWTEYPHGCTYMWCVAMSTTLKRIRNKRLRAVWSYYPGSYRSPWESIATENFTPNIFVLLCFYFIEHAKPT